MMPIQVQISAIVTAANELLTQNINTIVKAFGECTKFIAAVMQKTNKKVLQINQISEKAA